MKICTQAMSGSLESSDCLVMVKPADDLEIDLDSIVMKRYGNRIKEVIMATLQEMGVERGYFKIQDKGALDYCIKARMRTAIKRAGEANDR
ncbi:MAG: citrate lyase acyl carrier protein [bacterium]|jgi:citrate lyase subunit gamma (acyl carrier protein)